MEHYVLGIDVGGTTIKMGLFRADGALSHKWEIITDKTNGGQRIMPDIADAIHANLAECHLAKQEIVGIGMGIPGPVLDDATVTQCVNLGWGMRNVAAEMQELIGIPTIKVGNDANVAALGEMWQGCGQGYSNLVMVTLGTGVGGGVILHGRIVPGAFGAGGEIGHMKLSETETMPCACGQKGHLEQYASAMGIVRKARELLAGTNRPSILRPVQCLSAKDVLDAAKSGDSIALETVEFAGKMLGTALSYVSCTISPEIYVIGGGVSRAGAILLNTVQKHFIREAFHAYANTKFALAQLGKDAGMYGAAKMVL